LFFKKRYELVSSHSVTQNDTRASHLSRADFIYFRIFVGARTRSGVRVGTKPPDGRPDSDGREAALLALAARRRPRRLCRPHADRLFTR
jgi:hypothetical protein